MKYTVVLEKGESGYGAFVPDFPGCIVAGESREEVLELIKEAIDFHIEGLREDQKTIPIPHCDIAQVEVNVSNYLTV
jgi:predicted RNase H-like HicB family nuclease